MFEKLSNNDSRGQVGIGTLIVFIAMVLVAAIAAGVLINTAGFLQNSAEATGQQSSEQVTDRLQVINSVGTSVGTSTVDEATITVSKSPGAGDIDLTELSIEVIGPDGASTLVHNSIGDDVTSANGDYFTSSQLTGSEPNMITDESNRNEITLSLSAIAATGTSGTGLEEGSSATIRMTTDSGGTVTETITVPDSIGSNSAVQL